jgi:hypothetical protein
MNTNKKMPKNAVFFQCEKCAFKCSKISNYRVHILTSKHKRLTNTNEKMPKNAENENNICLCGKKYVHMSSLCKHKQICKYAPENIGSINVLPNNSNDVSKLTELVMNVVKQNNELTKQIIELSSKPTITNSNNTTNNNSFNLNFFLNETCKDALNITDFVNQLHVGIKDLEETGRLGYAEGISKIFINGLKQLNVNQRPVHCSDSKRETMYIKDENQWSNENTILTNAIRDVAHKNIQQIPVWTEKHPEHKDLSSKYNDKYMKLVSEAMPGSTKEESDKNYKKIMRNIMKESVIEK